MLGASSAQLNLRRRAGGDIRIFWFLHGVREEASEGNTRNVNERQCADKKKKKRWTTRGQSVCKQSGEYAWAGCSNPGNR